VPHKTPIIAGLLMIARSYCWKQTDVFNKFPAPHLIWAQVVQVSSCCYVSWWRRSIYSVSFVRVVNWAVI